MRLPPIGLGAGWLFTGCVLGLSLVTPGTAPLLAAQEAGPSLDKIRIPGVVRELAARLAAADRQAADQRWQDAVDEYLDVLREHGDDLIPIDPRTEPLATGQRFLQTRWLVHQRLANLGPEAWKAFRNRVHSSAQRRYDLACPVRDVGQLRRVVEEAFCTPAGGQALELLGDLAFERGDFAEAQHWWSLLVAPPSTARESGKSRPLLFPDPAVDTVVRVRAKQILNLLFQEQATCLPSELEAFRQAHGAATGTLAGRKGNLADIVEGLAAQGQGKVPADQQEWLTFGGDSSRNRPLPLPLSPALWAGGPAWRVRLDNGERVADSIAAKPTSEAGSARQLAFHPIICGGNAYVCDARLVRGFDLRTGRLTFKYDLLDNHEIPGDEDIRLKVPAPADVRYTLTAADGHLFVRLGAQWFGSPTATEKRVTASWLVCLRLPSAGGDKKTAPVERWAVQATAKDAAQVIFEGAPVVWGKSVFVAMSRLQGIRTFTSICCFDAETGNLRWQQDVVEAPEFSNAEAARCRQNLLTLAGPNLIYCSHAGAVVAVDASTGKRTWAVRYGGRGLKTREGLPTPRDLCPAMVAGSHVFVAPANLDRLLCLDAATGQSLWERDSIEVVHLLGVDNGRLVFTTRQGLRAVQASTGDDAGGWLQPAVGSLASHGRGLLAGGWVFWPTQDAKLPWRVVNLPQGGLVRGLDAYEPGTLQMLPAGNLVFGQRCLLIATTEELWGYAPSPPLVGPPQT